MNEKEIDSIYDDDNFKINKMLQIQAGLWPYASHSKKRIRQIVTYFVIGVSLIPVGNGVRTWCGVKFTLCGENIVAFIYFSTIISQYWVTISSENKLKKIYEYIAQNFLQITNPKERAILIKFARQGRVQTIGYLVYLIITAIAFCEIPMLPKVLDYFFPLNESRPLLLYIKAEYIFDPYKHFGKIHAFFILDCFITVIAVSSVDSMYSMIVHQIVGNLSIIQYRLYTATVSYDSQKDVSYNLIIESIKLHDETLQFIELTESAYTIFFLLLTGSTIVFLSVGVAVLMAQAQDSALDTFRLAMVGIGVLLHFLFNTWPGQLLNDHSKKLFLSTYENEWYNIQKKSKMLIQIMMTRCIKTSVFTAGGLYTMNFENFGSIIKTTISYIAAVASFV